jgi:hypothetical protein
VSDGSKTTTVLRADGRLMRRLTLWLPEELALQLRREAADRDCAQNDIVIEALRRTLPRRR